MVTADTEQKNFGRDVFGHGLDSMEIAFDGIIAKGNDGRPGALCDISKGFDPGLEF